MNETLIKYLSGLLDADGSISLQFHNVNKEKGTCTIGMCIQVSSSTAVDKHGFIDSLPMLTGFGISTPETARPHITKWTVQSRSHLEMLIPRLVKHMVVKGRHLQRLYDKWREKRGASISLEEAESLKEFSKSSRLDSGPMKPKNHPSWAWTAGYLDGNGSYRCGLKKDRDRYSYQNSVHASCHIGDVHVLEFLQKAFGGYIKPHSTCEKCMVWERKLGKADRSFALRFLPKLVNHSRLKKHKIEMILAFHHSQRSSGKDPTG